MIGKIEKKYSTVSSQEKVAKIIEWLEAKKATNVVVLDLEGVNSFTDAVVIATAKSVRQAKALADEVSMRAKGENYEHMRVEGKENAQWVLVDLNDVIVNIFQEDVRDSFNLESLWADAKVLYKSEAE
ncbi:ribosome silencing factor [Halodesulfovibrio sp.]|jgi:ribosome-associated protein|uniref:ribosome silencing factor n=1 Tax=Halodesulfovibrio sp. TaxID=1912772 RepID=UPI0025FEE57E|nr:ribosome silencing factor [Halodesulfovibrio sp.]MCT4534943.1 ribosome silencing factor [Halodesulfovibrio sp.]MCT4627744.1 ribosome silencing factor [Halodesulfovibrio sp.]